MGTGPGLGLRCCTDGCYRTPSIRNAKAAWQARPSFPGCPAGYTPGIARHRRRTDRGQTRPSGCR